MFDVPGLTLSLLNGLTTASHMFLMAAGLTVIFGVLGVLNFAHGALAMLGTYFSMELVRRGAGFWPGLILGPLGVAAVGAAVDRWLIRPVFSRPRTHHLLMTFAVTLMLMDLTKMLWGPGFYSTPAPDELARPVYLLGIWYPGHHLFAIGVALVVAAALWYFFMRTFPGRLVRAAASDPEMAAGLAVNVPGLFTAVFALGCWLAGFGGALMGTLMPATPASAIEWVVPTFAIVVIGGLGSVPGAGMGAILAGVLEAFTVLYAPRLQMGLLFGLMALVLVFRPRGLLGRSF